jgi:hypothetical protein
MLSVVTCATDVPDVDKIFIEYLYLVLFQVTYDSLGCDLLLMTYRLKYSAYAGYTIKAKFPVNNEETPNQRRTRMKNRQGKGKGDNGRGRTKEESK